MTRLWILSDLHLESVPYPSAFSPVRPEFDILVVAGDVWQANLEAGMSFLVNLANGKPIVMVLGNHEHRHGTVSDTIVSACVLAEEFGIALIEGREVEVAGVRFVGGTLWTDNNLGPAQDDDTWIGEELHVLSGNGLRKMTVGDARGFHASTVKAISDAMAAGGDLPLVVLTHHAPNVDCTASFEGTWAAGNSASDLSALTDAGKAVLWVHGHVHMSFDVTRLGGTRVICNPAGAMFSNPRFDEGLVVEV